MAKALGDSFADWESHVFGCGYGTGEPHVLAALKHFLSACPVEGTYDHERLEHACGPTVAWLLINALAKADIIEYGTSPRYGWLTDEGRRLKAFVEPKEVGELVALTCRDEDYLNCYPDACNCGSQGYEKGRICENPFWPSRRGTRSCGRGR